MRRWKWDSSARYLQVICHMTVVVFALGCVEGNPQPSPSSEKGGAGGWESENGSYAADCLGTAEDGTGWAPEITPSDSGGYPYPWADASGAGESWYWGPDVGYDDGVAFGDTSSGPPGYIDDPGPGGCNPNCQGKQCGPDGCGGSCGGCSAQASCQEGACVTVDGCTPACAGLMVGEDDGCGGVCSGGGFGIGLKPGGAQDVGYFRFLVEQGEVPDPEFFPIEGFLNEHDTSLPAPDYSMLVTLHAFVGLFYDPQADEPLITMQLGLNSGMDPAEIAEKHFNLVVVVDASGSMGSAGKLDFVKEGLHLMLDSLDENDTLAIVTYDSSSQVVLGRTAVTEESKPSIAAVIEAITPGSSTNLYAGMHAGYELAMQGITDGEALHRIMLLSDGVVNEGIEDLDTILLKSKEYNDEGIGITTIGVGLDFNFDLMYKLANQGMGNFYFLDDGEKLVSVFQHELEYLLTPVADNLKISFSLPKGFFVEEIYGFDYKMEGSEVVLMGPSEQYKVVPPGTNPGGGENNNGEADVAVSTLFASEKNGLLMVKIGAESGDIFDAWEAMDFATISYSYDLINEGSTESASKTVALGSLSYFAEDDPDSGKAYYTGPIMQRNFCVLRSALAVREACGLFHEEPPDVEGAVKQIADATTFCNGINMALDAPDPALIEDVDFMNKVKENICSVAECAFPL